MSARRKRRTAFLSPRRITGSGGSRRPVTWSRTHASDTHNSRATSLVVRRRLDCRSTGPISSELCSRSRIRNLLSFFQNRLIAERSHRRIAHVPFHRLTHPRFARGFRNAAVDGRPKCERPQRVISPLWPSCVDLNCPTQLVTMLSPLKSAGVLLWALLVALLRYYFFNRVVIPSGLSRA